MRLIDVANFVGNDSGKLVFVIGHRNQAAVDADIAAAGGKGIDGGRVNNKEVIAGWCGCVQREAIAQRAQVLGDFRLFQQFAALAQLSFNRHANIARTVADKDAFFGIAEIG